MLALLGLGQASWLVVQGALLRNLLGDLRDAMPAVAASRAAHRDKDAGHVGTWRTQAGDRPPACSLSLPGCAGTSYPVDLAEPCAHRLWPWAASRMCLPRCGQWHAAMTLEVLYSWDMMRYQVNTAPQVTHLIKVKVLQGPPEVAVGQEMILPYCDWATEEKPPGRFDVVTTSPAMWLRAKSH